MKIHKLEIDGETRIHAPSPISKGEYTLCGMSVSDGDDDFVRVKYIRDIIVHPKDAMGKIDCEECIVIINFCKSLDERI